jgi:hypothetical protein
MGGAGVDSNKLAIAGIGLGAAAILVYLAQQSTGNTIAGVPQLQTEAQFQGLDTDIGARVNVGTPLDVSASTHFYVSGYNCPGQTIVPPRHRYPLVCGGNGTAVINRGFDAMRLGSPDNSWRTQPPSEYTL